MNQSLPTPRLSALYAYDDLLSPDPTPLCYTLHIGGVLLASGSREVVEERRRRIVLAWERVGERERERAE